MIVSIKTLYGGYVLGGSAGSRRVMDEWLVGQQIVSVISCQQIFGLYGLKGHILEKRQDFTIVMEGKQTTECEDKKSTNKGLIEILNTGNRFRPRFKFKRMMCMNFSINLILQSLLCSLFYKQTCSRFTWLFGISFVRSTPCPKYHFIHVLDNTNHEFSESSRFEDIQTVPKCLIHKYTSARKTQHVVCF